ncbi:glycoside hydrolase family 97 catalytic domain-containing protein [Pelagicoccus sp. SDUM812003]|uniref:glycoside hydrolase family 97 protein n=1 Tax=Pelagicoccus sp. SDUM812003 TaxID=3041267 RepID=UPI00280D60EE|nr:glycoside hydrolase family 97 catalytic domain-containing protein [Pelagicoccus sp. SDUM812003]MDQ8202406.1 glycoside hydrolase family 97 catalytic domain-containing protein [Pelagicoccus sp. SDUM812003]
MKSSILRSAALSAALSLGMASLPAESITLESPNGQIDCVVTLEEGLLSYTIEVDGVQVLEPSDLGVILQEGDFSRDLSLISSGVSETVKDSYRLKHGKQSSIDYLANRRALALENAQGEALQVVFQISDDGVAFRYVFPDESAPLRHMTEEVTSFNFPTHARAWMQPMSLAKTGFARTNPSYEEHYQMDIPVGTPAPWESGWVYPALFKVGEIWVSISESDLGPDYCGTRLRQHAPDGEYKVGFPQSEEIIRNGELNPQGAGLWKSPWRVIALGNLDTLIESTLVTDLASPAIEGDFSWVEPGRASWSWVLLKDDFTVYPTQVEFIDYAAEMGWEYCLIDSGWDHRIGYEKIEELVDYAAGKGVKILLWYNSAGSWNDSTHMTPAFQMIDRETRRKELARISAMGVAGVKVDFFGGDGQSNIQYYHEILQDTAEARIAVNFHGCTLPRGWHRTYPHLMTMESIKGQEFITFDQGNADLQPSHSALIPFTRNLFDPMDFTPTVLGEIPNIERRTTDTFELALPVLFLSGIQHYAETPEGMSQVPEYAKQYLREVPVSWDESQLLLGDPGKTVVIARRAGESWYIGAINGEDQEKTISVTLPGTGTGTLITDAVEGDEMERRDLSGKQLTITLRANGGFAAKVKAK